MKRVFLKTIHAVIVCVLVAIGLSGCLSYYRYCARLRICSDIYNSWNAEDTVWLRFVCPKQVPSYIDAPRKYYHSDCRSLIVFNYEAECGIDTMNCGSFRYLADQGHSSTTIQEYEVDGKYAISKKDFLQIAECDTICLYLNEEQLACWTKDNISTTYKNIFDYENVWTYSYGHNGLGTCFDAVFELSKSDIRKLKEMKTQR